MKFLICLLFLQLLGCSGLVQSLQGELDNDPNARPPQQDRFDMYRKSDQKKGVRPSSSSDLRVMPPSVDRQYQNSEQKQTRKQAKDLEDNGNDGSLWSGDSSNVNYLFSKTTIKRTGDIILIFVQSTLKNDITLELKREFAEATAAAQASDSTTAIGADPNAPPVKPTPAVPGAAGAAPPTPEVSSQELVHDKISSVIIEEISKEHLLLKGRKEILYHNRKRLIEIQALVPRRDITDNNTVESDKFIETQIQIIR